VDRARIIASTFISFRGEMLDTMRAVTISDHGGPEALNVEEIDRPEPDADEVLIEVGAAGVNPVDTYFRDGSYEPVGLPFTPGVDVAGTVVGVGEGVDSFEAGDRVYGTGIGNGQYQGAYAEYATAPTDRIVELPENAGMTQAGARASSPVPPGARWSITRASIPPSTVSSTAARAASATSPSRSPRRSTRGV